MTPARHHAEWLSLVETSGPFLSMPVLLRVFPQGLDQRDPAKASRLREAYEDWLERGAKLPAVHQAWVRHVLTELLEYPAEILVEGQGIPPGMEAVMASYGETIRPDYALLRRADAAEGSRLPCLLIQHYDPDQELEKPLAGKMWKASPATRMMELLHAANVPLGLLTNGEQWMWLPANTRNGYPWNFTAVTAVNENPCTKPWQGITCLLHKAKDPYYHLSKLELIARKLTGTIPCQ